MTDITEPMRSRSPRRTIIITLAVLALTWFIFPAPVASWVTDHCEDGPICPLLQSIADSVDGASHSIGLAGPLEESRDALRTNLGIDFY
ncbi:MAG: hypothetical protein ABIP15_16860 [Devosia sp.]